MSAARVSQVLVAMLTEVILILIILAIVVGVGKLPQLASSMGRMRAEFKRGMVEGTPVDITPRAGAEPAAASPGRKPGHPDNKVEEATFDEPSSPR